MEYEAVIGIRNGMRQLLAASKVFCGCGGQLYPGRSQ